MKIALVTGASSGIGAEASRQLSVLGYRVILVKRELLYPFLLRVYGWSHRVTPAFVLWLLRVTGQQRR